MAGHDLSGESLLVSQLALVERVIAFVCARHHLRAPDREDFASHVKLKLVEDDYAILRKFESRSSLRTYLTIVIQRLFLDYRNSAWGKWRPSAEAKRGGAVSVLLEQLIARDGHAFEEACELLRTNHGVTEGRDELERMAGRLPVRLRRQFETDEALADVPSGDRPIDEVATAREQQAEADRLWLALKTCLSRLDIQDRLILTLRFEDGRTVADIAAMLRLDQNGLYRRVERLLRALRKSLEADGIDGASVLEMLESPAVSIEWNGFQEGEKAMTRPSIPKGAPQWR